MDKLIIKKEDLVIDTLFDKRTREKQRQLADFRRFITYKSSGKIIKKYIGAELFFIRERIESMFSDGMDWKNYGSVWVIDHIVPIRMFDVFDENDLCICWNYRNLMPLFKEDNLKKEGNVFFAIELLYKFRNKDYMYTRLFNRVKEEGEWMLNYIDKYNNGI